jgi:tetratricopeptide (TPR) repeat protein
VKGDEATPSSPHAERRIAAEVTGDQDHATPLRAARARRDWTKAQLISAMRWAAKQQKRSLVSDESLSRNIATWENGHSKPDDFYQSLLCTVYDATPDVLGFAEPASAADDLADELVTRLEVACSVDASLIALLRAETDSIRLRDRRLGAKALDATMRAHLNQVEELLRYGTFHTERSGLAYVLADASALAGWQAIDTGSLRDAWDHFERGKAAAREAEDADLLAFATAEQAYVLLDLNRPTQALNLMQHARQSDHGRLAPRMRSWLSAAEAEAHAELGDGAAALRLIDSAAGELPDGDADENLPYLSLNLTHLARWRGSCLVKLGDRDAIDDLTTALENMDGAYNRAAAGLRCDLATAFAARGDASAAREHLEHARRLVAVVGSVRQRRRLDHLSKTL